MEQARQKEVTMIVLMIILIVLIGLLGISLLAGRVAG
jgi:hypothetical protein